jgi:16S rRNA processing protein RimM
VVREPRRRVGVGRVGKSHGLGGAFVVEGASEDAQRFAVGARLYADGEEVEVVESKRSGGRPVIRLDRHVERGAALEVERAALPEPAPDHYYVADLVGCAVERDDGTPLGRVTDVEELPANAFLTLDTGLLLPLVDACVREVDLSARRIVVAPGYDRHD